MSGRVALEASFSLRQYGAWCDRGRCDRVAGHAADLWTALLDVGEAAPQGWVLIGGQMVLLHAIEHGVAWPRVSMDLDVIVNARVTRFGAPVRRRNRVDWFRAGRDEPGDACTPHRRGRASIDVLAPEGVGERTDLTTSPPGHTLQVPGGTQALRRAELVR